MKLVPVARKDLRILYASALVYISEHPDKDNTLIQGVLAKYTYPAMMEDDDEITN